MFSPLKSTFHPRIFSTAPRGPVRQLQMLQTVRYMNGDELADLIKSGKVPKKDFVVIDVRDDDYAGGNIKGSINYPSREFLLNVDGLVRETKQSGILFADPVASGPKAARIYSETRQNVLDNNIQYEVAILRDGFSQFQVKHKDDPELVENWDKDAWASEWS